MAQKTYTVTFPDGHVQEFSSVEGLSENDAIDRAIQERSIAEGKTATTYGGGVKQDLASEAKGFAAGLNPASLILGLPRALTETLATARAKATDSALPFEQQAAGVQTTIDESKKPHPAEPGQSGQMLGSLLLGTLLGNVVPKGVKAAVNSPTGKAVGAVAHDLPVVGKTIKALGKGAEAYREARASTGELSMPYQQPVQRSVEPAIESIAREPQPVSSFGTPLNPDALTPADIAANMKSAQLLKTAKPASITELLEAQAAPESLTLQSGAPIATEELLQLIESLRQGRH